MKTTLLLLFVMAPLWARAGTSVPALPAPSMMSIIQYNSYRINLDAGEAATLQVEFSGVPSDVGVALVAFPGGKPLFVAQHDPSKPGEKLTTVIPAAERKRVFYLTGWEYHTDPVRDHPAGWSQCGQLVRWPWIDGIGGQLKFRRGDPGQSPADSDVTVLVTRGNHAED